MADFSEPAPIRCYYNSYNCRVNHYSLCIRESMITEDDCFQKLVVYQTCITAELSKFAEY